MDTPAATKYASVVLQESVRIALLLADSNNLDVLSVNVHNAYLNVTHCEKTWLKVGP